jgi:aerobic-type carbon monoxide dehydrogenase small subunit (CoxS/CutS family)
MAELILRINGAEMRVEAGEDESLLSVLRNRLLMTGTKYGCGEGECGACTILLDGKPARACLALASAVSGSEITTIEGLEQHGQLSPVQQAFLDVEAFQCAFCTSGMILATTSLLEEHEAPTEAQILEAMDGNICRCGTYPRIVAAIQQAAKQRALKGSDYANA